MTVEQIELAAPAYKNAPDGPWTLALRHVVIREGQPGWRVQAESPNYKYGDVTAMTYQEHEYEKALTHFEKLKDKIDLSVPADAERHARCTYCRNITTMRAFFSVIPWLDHDDDYCGCRGWD